MERVKHCDAPILGPGMSISPRTDQLVAGLLTEPCPQRTIVLDAAALTSASELAPVIARHEGRVILTPHHGEMAQLAGIASEAVAHDPVGIALKRSEEHTSELQTLMRFSYTVFCLKQTTQTTIPSPK